MTEPERRVPCYYPDPDWYASLPEGFDEWRDPTGFCRHQGCIEAEAARLTRPPSYTAEEREMIESDHELMADEMHGRDLEGRTR